VTLRKVPGAVVLGLLASLMAHAALYGDGHAMGGTYHALLMQLALGGLVAFAACVGALMWSEAGRTADGSVLAARLRQRLPGLGVLPAAIIWYVTAEAAEPHHAAASVVASLAAIALASLLVERLARALVAVLAHAVIAIARASFSPRAPAWRRWPSPSPIPRRPLLTRRRFARPPPITFVTLRAAAR
jgi:hypothetical protein